MECESVQHPEAIKLLRLLHAGGWTVQIGSSTAPFEVSAERRGERRLATGETLVIAVCKLAEACGIDGSKAA